MSQVPPRKESSNRGRWSISF